MVNQSITKLIINNLKLTVFILIFVTMFGKLFTADNTLIGVGAITAFLMFKDIGFNAEKKLTIIMFFGLFLLSIFATISIPNLFIQFIIDFMVIFLIILLCSDQMEMKAYVPFVLCYLFVKDTPAPLIPRINALLFSAFICVLAYLFLNKYPSENKKLKEIVKVDVDSLRFQLIIKMALGISIALLIANILQLQKGMWISITVMSLTQPCYAETNERIRLRILGTVCGSFIFVLLFEYLIPDNLIVFVTLVMSYLYNFIRRYDMKMIFITISSLSSAMLLFDTYSGIFIRLLSVVCGGVIAYLINHMNVKIYHWHYQRKLVE